MFTEFAVRALTAIVAPFENPVGTARPLWRDYSKYQGQVNFDVAAQNGVLGMAARAGISWGYQDQWFPNNWSESGRVGMYRTSYHVIYPDQPIIKQADNWYQTHPNIEFIPRVIDLELNRGLGPKAIADATWNMSEVVKQRDGVRPIIYSRYTLINPWLASWTDSMLNEHFWWLAQYTAVQVTEHAGPPTLPQRIREDRVILHQTSGKKAGFSGEVESASVDWDRWEIGNASEMHQWISENWGSSPIPVPDYTLEEKVDILWDAHPELHA